MTADDSQHLQVIIQTLNNGVTFYREAANNSELDAHKSIFECMLKARLFALTYLQPFLQQQSQTEGQAHAFGSVLHKMYPDILYGLDSEHDIALIEQLEQVENETLSAMQAAMKHIQSPLLKSVLLDLYPRLNRRPDAAPWRMDQAS